LKKDYSFSEFDSQGYLNAPGLFWLVLIFQARTWVLLIIAGASRDQGDALLRWFYPDNDVFWLGLLPGIPAALAFILSGRRARLPRLWPLLRPLLIMTQCLLFIWQCYALTDEGLTAMTALLLVADLLALSWLIRSQRLRDYFALLQE